MALSLTFRAPGGGSGELCELYRDASLGSSRPSLEDWLAKLMDSRFFNACSVHGATCKKAEATFFCIDCAGQCGPLCQHCMSSHQGHTVLQIRRYVYCDVVRANDIMPYVDILGVQSYIINQAKVVFLNPRPQSKVLAPGAPDSCATCHRSLREGSAYCSLACKVRSLADCGLLGQPASPGSDASDSAAQVLAPLGGRQQQQQQQRDTSRLARLQRPTLAGSKRKAAMAQLSIVSNEFEQQLHQQAKAAARQLQRSLSLDLGLTGGCGAAAVTDAAALLAVDVLPPLAPLHIPPLQILPLETQGSGTGCCAGGWDSRRSSDSDHSCDTRTGGLCCRRKQMSPRRAPSE